MHLALTHRRTLDTVNAKYVVGANFWIDGKPPEGELMQVFEPQIEYSLDLSFLKCNPVAESDYVAEPHSQEIFDDVRKREPSIDR